MLSKVGQLFFKGNLGQATVKSLIYISQLSESQLNTVLEQFRSQIFTNNIKIDYSQCDSDRIGHQYNDLFERLTHLKPYIQEGQQKEVQPQGIIDALMTITEFCDKGKIGFLSGDLSKDLMHFLFHHLSYIETQKLSDNSQIYTKLEEFLCQQEFSLPLHGIQNSDRENPQALFIRQLHIERDATQITFQNAKNDFETITHGAFGLNYLTPKEKLMQIFLPFCKLIQDEQKNCLLANLTGNRKYYANIIVKFSADKLAMLTLSSILKIAVPLLSQFEGSVDIKVSNLVRQIGQDVKKQLMEDRTNSLFNDFKKKRQESGRKAIKDEKILRKMLTNELREIKQEYRYSDQELDQVGAILLQLLTQSVTIRKQDILVSTFTYEVIPDQDTKNKSIGVIRLSKEFLQLLMGKVSQSRSDQNVLTLDRVLPMICKPARWIDWETGGFFQKGIPIMRLQGSRLQKTALQRADLSQICDVLNIMGDTPWSINQKVLDVVEEVYKKGGGLGEIPIVDDGTKFSNFDSLDFFGRQRQEKEQRDNWSLLSDFEIKLGIARHYKNIDKFYMPLNLDFRGRIYPISPHLNQLGNDLSRGLMQFARGKPLQKSGLYWLKVHLANKMGYDKLPMPERHQVAEDFLPEALQIAKDPLKYDSWLQFEDPWQSLATIFDLAAALETGNPESYVSRLHIHQDGSCNGLQHYAALGRDIEGAEQVNLADRERPGDVYTAVTIKVQKKVAEDAANGHKIAIQLADNIKRKTVKQTVMTSVYGVTFIGARDQIKRQLKDKELLPEEDLVAGAQYLAKITMDAIAGVFNSAYQIKEWLIRCAGEIAKSGHAVSWITPLGLPVIQPYRRGQNTMFIDTIFQRISLINNKDYLPVSVPKQKSAFPPNYVHSLDSTHLMYTAKQCYLNGIEFAAVHDSFWTHACDINTMNGYIREQFVNLHSQPLLDDLLESFRKRYPKIKFEEVPKRGNFDLNLVLNSTYFFA